MEHTLNAGNCASVLGVQANVCRGKAHTDITVLIFPSYLQHRVSPLRKGKRVSFVGWFEGPR